MLEGLAIKYFRLREYLRSDKSTTKVYSEHKFQASFMPKWVTYFSEGIREEKRGQQWRRLEMVSFP